MAMWRAERIGPKPREMTVRRGDKVLKVLVVKDGHLLGVTWHDRPILAAPPGKK